MWLFFALAFGVLTTVCVCGRAEHGTARWRVMAALALCAIVGMGLTWPEKIILNKLITRAIMPCGIVWFGLLAAMLFAWLKRERGTAVLLGVVIAIFTALGNDWLAHRLANGLENQVADINPLKAGHFDAVFVLGGSTGTTPANIAQLDTSGDRVMLAARMFHLGQIDFLITTGSRIEGLHMIGRDPSVETREIWENLGIPPDHILELDGRNTREEMQGARGLQDKHQWKRLGVISSAQHLPRALKLAEAQELKLEPLPANFDGGETPWTEMSLIPDAASLYTSHKAVKEYLGMFVGG